MGIGLMAYIPHQVILGGIEGVMKGYGQLHRPKIGAKMSSTARHRFDQKRSQLVGQALKLRGGQRPHIGGRVDSL